MLMEAALFLLAENYTITSPDGDWTLNYSVVTDGPVTTYTGTARLHFTEEKSYACFSYDLEHGGGELFGPAVSSSPGEPILPFDVVDYEADSICLAWCLTSSPLQVQPVSVPRFFNFSVRKTDFGPDDLTRLLAQWGQSGGWDLDGDGVVGGTDLNELLSNWKKVDGEAS